MTFVQRQVPQLSHVCTLTQSNKMTNIDFCCHLICAAQSAEIKDTYYIIYPAKIGYISIVTLQQGCIISKTMVQIVYSYNFKISAMVTQVIKQSDSNKQQQNKLTKGIYLFIGFQDGTISMYLFIQNAQSKPLAQIFKTRPNIKKKQPIINVKIIDCNLIVVCAYKVFIYKDIFKKTGQTKSSIGNLVKGTNATNQQQIKIHINSCKLNIQFDSEQRNIYVFNELQGAICLSLVDYRSLKVIQDNIKIMKCFSNLAKKQCNIIAIGTTDDCIKFINYETNTVEKFKGFKNYPTFFQQDCSNNILWVSSLDGSIACFQYKDQLVKKEKQFVMHQSTLKHKKLINGYGIKKIISIKNTFVVFDTHHNIHFYDIIPNIYESQNNSSNLQQSSQQQSEST